MDIGLTTLHEDDIAKHLPTAQSMLERTNVMVADGNSSSKTKLAGTKRRFVSTVSMGADRRTFEVKLLDTLNAVSPDDNMLSIAQHTLAFRIRRAIAVGLAIQEVFARQSELETLSQENMSSPLSGDDASRFHKLLAASAFTTVFAAASYITQTLEAKAEAGNDPPEPQFDFDSPHEAIKILLWGLDRAVKGAPEDSQLIARARAFAQSTIDGLLARHKRFPELAPFEDTHIRLDSDDFEMNGFNVVRHGQRKPLIMEFKKPDEVVGNHIAKYQSVKLSKMLMAYDFDRQMNPFAELGGFIFTFVGDGFPGTGKTTLIKMIAGLMKNYCDIAGYPFHYENFGVDQISSYQGKSGQNCRQFIENVLDPRVIGFGTVDDIDQVASRRSDDKASAGQHEITAVLMEAFSGANTVIRGNCSFGMFSNYPENVDDALRQRASARWLVDGPQTRDDYIDIFALLIGSNHKLKLGKHELYAAQEIQRAVEEAYEKHNAPMEQGLAEVKARFDKNHGAIKTLADIGAYLHAIKVAEPRFTGRAIKNITDAAKMRAMDIELPDEWFEKPETFMHQDYDTKKDMISELRSPISLDMIIQEINRYADSEFRYTDKSDEAAVERMKRDHRLRERAAREITQEQETK